MCGEVGTGSDDRADAIEYVGDEHGATLENVLRVARALGVLDVFTDALDPYASDVGRLRADEALPERVRHRRAQ